MPGREFGGGAGVGLGEYFSCCGQPPEQILGCPVRQVQVLRTAGLLGDQFEDGIEQATSTRSQPAHLGRLLGVGVSA